jgi:RNA polymerase sigma-70 factor, ECF subfamily
MQPFAGPGRVVGVTTTVSPARAGAPPETPTPVPPTFDEVYAAHYADLTVQLYAYFGDRQEAQDVVQEAFVRALARWQTISTYDDPVAWVRRVAWNLAVSRWRKARTALNFVRRQRHDEKQTDGPNPERVALVEALSKLPDTMRRAMVLRYMADLPVAEIAEREGVPEGTVKSWLHRGRAALAAELRPAEEARRD